MIVFSITNNLFLCLIFINILNFICCQDRNVLKDVISNPIIMQDRNNRILFVISENCSESTYQKLLNTFLYLEKESQSNYTGADYNIHINFGDTYNINFTKEDNFYETYGSSWCSKDDKCFAASQIDEINILVSNFIQYDKLCPEKIAKEFILIVSDICVTSLTKQFNDVTRCSMNYRNVWLLLPTEDDVNECKKELSQYGAFESILSNETISVEIEKYFDMDVMFYSTMASSKFNFLFMLKEAFYPMYNYFELKFDNIPLCTKGSMVGFFQYLFSNKPDQRVTKMALPLNYNNPSFVSDNYKRLVRNSSEQPYYCSFIQEFLVTANSMPTDQEQWNVLLIDDPYPRCLDIKLFWTNENRHLEIIVINSGTKESDYSKFILFPENSLNHITFLNEPYDLFGKDTTICRSNVSSRKITDKPHLIVTVQTEGSSAISRVGTSSQQFKTEDPGIVLSTVETNNVTFNPSLLIIGGILLVMFIICFIIGSRYFYIKLTSKKRLSSIRQNADSITSLTKTERNERYWKMLINDKDLIINMDTVLGKGSNATVFEAIMKTKEIFRLHSMTKVAAKISTNPNDVNEFMIELKSLTLLMGHPNIIELKGWTFTSDSPVIVMELAESNLLDFVKSSINSSEVDKNIIQILWQISSALNYVANNKSVHRDVACRNVLLTEKNIAKLADFGLCCEMKETGIYQDPENKKKFPIKWLSIEVLTQGIFSEKSDVWAFGVLCYEAFSFGAIPYSSMSNTELIEFLHNGKRLEKPENALDCIYEIMLNCWEKDPSARATFKEIHNMIEQVLEYGYLPLITADIKYNGF